jgi:hypothetical protein
MPDDFIGSISYLEGVNKFQNARFKAFVDEILGLVRGKSTELLSYEDVRARLRLREEDYRGLQEIPLDKIVGSVGRYHEFTRSFLPKRNAMQERWSRVYAVATGMQGLPPIEVYKVGDVYFVRDGNHRVSVARQLGARTIQAHVTELRTSIPLSPDMGKDDLDAAEAYARFLEHTQLSVTRPLHQSMMLSEPSRYVDMLGHIYLHRDILSQTRGEEVPLEEAAADWYDNVYRPAVTLIRKYNIMERLPKYTEADLYLWMIDHLRDAREEFGDEAKARSFSDALVDYLTQKRIPIPKDLLIEKDATVELARFDIDAALAQYREALEDEVLDEDDFEA